MEASDQSGQDQHLGQEPDQSQEQPTQDSGLQTPQPDQPVPTEPERQTDDSQVSQPESVGGSTASPGPSGQPAEGTVSADPLADPDLSEASRRNVEQEQAEVQKEQELEQDRRERNERLGGEGTIEEGEVQAQRQEHNERTGGGDVPQAQDSAQEG